MYNVTSLSGENVTKVSDEIEKFPLKSYHVSCIKGTV